MLCDLLSAQAAVLEHNFSPQVAAQYKHAALADVTALSRLVAEHLPELGEHQSIRLAAATVMVTGSIWVRTQPSMAMLAAYDADPVLAAMRMDFTDTLHEVLEVFISGLLGPRQPLTDPDAPN